MYLHFELAVFLVRFIYIPYKATTRRLDVWQSSKHSSELRNIGYYDIRIKMKITTIKAIWGATSFPKFLGSPPLFLNTDNINISIFIKVYSKKCFMGVIMFVMVVECAVFTSRWCSCKGLREAEKITTPTPITFTRKRNIKILFTFSLTAAFWILESLPTWKYGKLFVCTVTLILYTCYLNL